MTCTRKHVEDLKQPTEEASPNGNRPETVLLALTTDGTVKIGLPPRHLLDDFPARAVVVGKLENVSHVICSPEGELFCVHDGDLYRGPLPSKKGADWFSTANRVGKKWEWSRFKTLFFHPNGELYATTNDGDFYKGPQPKNENVPWLYGQATQIGAKGWEQCEALCFDLSGILYAVTTKDNIVKGKPPTTAQEYEEWLSTSRVVGGCDWLGLSHFISFCPDGKLWTVEKENGNIYRGTIPEDGKYKENADHLGWGYHAFNFLTFTSDKTISNIINLEFLPEKGKRISENPEVIEEKIYNNRSNTTSLNHTFTFAKTVKTSSSFSQEHGFTFEVGSELKVQAGIPSIAETEATVHMNMSTTHNWSITKTNETEISFSSTSEVEVQPGNAIRVVASVVRAEMVVPYRARVRTLFGSETDIEGTWHGASVYNLRVTQEDCGN